MGKKSKKQKPSNANDKFAAITAIFTGLAKNPKIKEILENSGPALKKIKHVLRSSKTKLSLALNSRHSRLLRRLLALFFIVGLTVFTVIYTVLKAPSGRESVRKWYYKTHKFNLDKELILQKARYDVIIPQNVKDFPGRPPTVPIKVLQPLDSLWRTLESPYFVNGTVIFTNLSPTAGSDKWLKKGVMMRVAHMGYKPIAVNLPVDEIGHIENFKTQWGRGLLFRSLLHQMGIQNERTYVVFGGPAACVVLPYLRMKNYAKNPDTGEPWVTDALFKGLFMVIPNFCSAETAELKELQEQKFWIILNQESDNLDNLEPYNTTLPQAIWKEVHEEIEIKAERKNALWPIKEKNRVFMRYFRGFLGDFDVSAPTKVVLNAQSVSSLAGLGVGDANKGSAGLLTSGSLAGNLATGSIKPNPQFSSTIA